MSVRPLTAPLLLLLWQTAPTDLSVPIGDFVGVFIQP